jgi:hypothetical protein
LDIDRYRRKIVSQKMALKVKRPALKAGVLPFGSASQPGKEAIRFR